MACRCIPRGDRSAPRLVPELAAGRPGDTWSCAVSLYHHQWIRDRRGWQEDVEIAWQFDRAGRHHQRQRRGYRQAMDRDERLPRGDPCEPGNPRARSRSVPQAAQHAALSAGKPVRFRSRDRRGAARRAGRSRPLHPRTLCRRGSARARRLRALRLRGHRAGADAVRHGRSQRLLQRHLEGSALHAGRRLGGAALGSDGDLSDGGRPDAAPRADSVIHRRRTVAVSARRSR